MIFTDEHKRILEKNRPYFDNLQATGTLTKISSVIVDEFKIVYKEAISERRFNTWCTSCIIELIELVYNNYDKYLANERETKSTAGQGTSREQSELSKSKGKRKNV